MKTIKNHILHFLKTNWANLIVFTLCFCGVVVLSSAYWIAKHFEVKDFGQILFHLQFPLLGNGTPLVGSYLLNVVLFSFVIAFFIAWSRLSARLISRAYLSALAIANRFNRSKISAFKISFSLVLLALCINITINKFRIKDYFNTQMQYSNLYEWHYKPFDFTQIAGFSPKQNLVIVFVESLETNLQSQIATNGGGGTPLI